MEDFYKFEFDQEYDCIVSSLALHHLITDDDKKDEINTKWLPKYYEEDSPAWIGMHIKWLQEIGFRDVDIIWKYYNYAVYGGYK